MAASGKQTAAMKRSRNPHGSGELLRQELIDAAGRLLAAGASPEGLSLRAVAREAGVAAPSVYLQFENRDALVDAVVAAHFRELAAEVIASYDGVTAPYQRLLLGCRAYLRFAEAHPGAYRIIFESSIPVLNPHDLTGSEVFQILVDAVETCLPA
ncbi:MAG: TetR/AcrR family transcriptional regulator, partial [Thermomicrobiales bacterium]